MKRLKGMIGLEQGIAETARELRGATTRLGVQGVGAMHVTCADESEHECQEAFLRSFARDTLPRLKYGERVPFRLANPGARYEWGTVRIAEDHFATQEARAGTKLMVVKLAGHVAADRTGRTGLRFGELDRYDYPSAYCGAMAALLGGSRLPFALDLADALRSEGRDRVAQLQAMDHDDDRRMLFGALCSARLQARQCVLDIQDHKPAGPTIYVVLHGVTLNRPGQDSEILGGFYLLDHRTPQRDDVYVGLGDDPTEYELAVEHGRVRVRDPHVGHQRDARDHRAMAAARLRGLAPDARALGAPARAKIQQLRKAGPRDSPMRRVALRGLLAALSAASPVAAALVLVAEGVAAIHHAPKLDRAVDADVRDELARDVVADVEAKLDTLSPEDVQRLASALEKHLAPAAV